MLRVDGFMVYLFDQEGQRVRGTHICVEICVTMVACGWVCCRDKEGQQARDALFLFCFPVSKLFLESWLGEFVQSRC